jgi:hypothetical protein
MGRWIAYFARESDRQEVFVMPLRFLFSVEPAKGDSHVNKPPIVVVNWPALLRK